MSDLAPEKLKKGTKSKKTKASEACYINWDTQYIGFGETPKRKQSA